MGYSPGTPRPNVSSAYVVQIIPSNELEREALSMENLLQAFLLDEPFALEFCGDHERQRFLVRTESKEALETLSQQLLAHYPQAQLRRVSPVADPLLISGNEHAVIGDFVLRMPTWMPIKTFWNSEMTQVGTDPIVGVLAAMEPVGARERIICQISLVNAPNSWRQQYQRRAWEGPLDKERRATAADARGVSQDNLWLQVKLLLATIVVFFLSLQGYVWYQHRAWGLLALLGLLAMSSIAAGIWWQVYQREVSYDMKLAAEKLMRTAFYARLRVIVIGSESQGERRLHQHLERLEVAYRQYDLAGANSFKLQHVQHIVAGDKRANQLCHPRYSLPYHHLFVRVFRRGWSSIILNAREVSGMWHLIQSQAEAPLVERLATKRILAAPDVFQRIKCDVSCFPPVLAGHSIHRGYTVPVYLPEETLFSHKFAVAKSGYGKSTLMQLLLRGAMQPIQSSERLQPGVIAIDPHGDLIEDLLRQVPGCRAREVVLVDLSDEGHPVGINLLDATMGFTCDQAVANAMASFSRIWKDSWGPRLAYVLRNTLKTLYTANEQLVAEEHKNDQYTLIDINPVLQQSKYTRKILANLDKNNIQHQKIISFWNDYYFKLPPNMQQEVISPVSNKIGIFSDNRALERIVGQPVTTINIAGAMQKGQIVLVNLASGRLEFEAAAIIGATILNLAHRTLQLQATVPLPRRRQIFIAVDEFQNIPGADYEALLSEDRKYGASLFLATQSLIRLEQMKEGLQTITFSNCPQLFVFATSAEDAETLEKELHSQVAIPHILSQPRLNCYARVTLSDQPPQIFSMHLAKPASWQRTPESVRKAEAIRLYNQACHPTSTQVDEYLAARAKRVLNIDNPAQSAAAKQNQPQNQPATARQKNAQPAAASQKDGQSVAAKQAPAQPTIAKQKQPDTAKKGSTPANAPNAQAQPKEKKPSLSVSQPASDPSESQNKPVQGSKAEQEPTIQRSTEDSSISIGSSKAQPVFAAETTSSTLQNKKAGTMVLTGAEKDENEGDDEDNGDGSIPARGVSSEGNALAKKKRRKKKKARTAVGEGSQLNSFSSLPAEVV